MINSDPALMSAEEVQVVEDPQRPVSQSFCVSLFRNAHWKCLMLTFIIWLCISLVIWCHCGQIRCSNGEKEPPNQMMISAVGVESYTSSHCDNGYIYIPLGFALLFYLIYLVECWNCHTCQELRSKIEVSLVYEHVKRIQEALPFVWWEVICYHYVRRSRQITRYRNGDAFTSTQIYYERVNSFATGSAFNFAISGCQDASRQLNALEDFSATKIRFSKGFSFENENSKIDFESQRSDFFQENESRDEYMECREGMEFINMRPPEYIIAVNDRGPHTAPWYFSHVKFLLASLLMLSWPVRVFIQYKTAYLHYHVHKVFGHLLAEDASSRISGSIRNTLVGAHRRALSINSIDLDYFLSTNLQQLPSYSEALLMPLPNHEHHPSDSTDAINFLHSGNIRSGSWERFSPYEININYEPFEATHEETSSTTQSTWVQKYACTNLSSRWLRGWRGGLRRNTSDSYIVQYCVQSSAAPINNVILEENNTTIYETERNHQSALDHENLPDYETALFLPKVAIRKVGAKLAKNSKKERAAFTRQLNHVTRSRSTATLSQALIRGMQRLTRSRSEYSNSQPLITISPPCTQFHNDMNNAVQSDDSAHGPTSQVATEHDLDQEQDIFALT